MITNIATKHIHSNYKDTQPLTIYAPTNNSSWIN